MTEGTGEDSPTTSEIAVADDRAVNKVVGACSAPQVSVSPSHGDCYSGASGEASESLELVVEVHQGELRLEGETFEERCTRFGGWPEDPARGPLWHELKTAAEAEAERVTLEMWMGPWCLRIRRESADW